ncbi:hypothetical protein SAMD00019534_043390 [Acytostelium subglobosum LB1]|uniref:hypothetical protein n=1 Tax=Acytostelium subglobosum LB1 TaxID=1410327 RepID=UPI0006449B75|nr:hypothetical protein SAMD00019534_043390 [Acytostelium subglobosum LB1]GAM21164.1 hypothetical protein SAMD00019534_043390 [Acytostelium subglobosum LB1]|eukprot:XP_012756298.1 hypothetical protein SAMD00019534_043390 [Acytostelium subglobosum LB1]
MGFMFPAVTIFLALIFNFLININPSLSDNMVVPFAKMPLTINPSVNGTETPLLNVMQSTLEFQYEMFPNISDMNAAILNDSLMYQLGGYDFANFNNQSLFTNIYFNYSSTIPSLTQSYYISLYKYLTGHDLFIEERQSTLDSGVTFKLFEYIGPILIQYGYVFLVPYFAILVVIDREKGIKNHLFLNSLQRKVYWSGYLLADLLCFLIPAILGWMALAIARIDGFYNNAGSFFLFVCFGFSAIPFGYLLQFAFDKEETANKWLYPLTSLFSLIPSVIITFAAPGGQAPSGVQLALSLLPSYSLYNGLSQIVRHQGNVGLTIMMQCISGVLCLFLIYIAELIINRPTGHAIKDIEQRSQKTGDADVVAERNLITSGDHNRIITVDGIFKQFFEEMPDDKSGVHKRRIKYAVDGVWFGVENGECFGLLGHNGAGKTTLLNIMTGVLNPDAGSGSIDGHNVNTAKELAFQSVGSCPQFDILFDNLTISEHLKFFSWIKCLPKADIQSQIDYFIQKFEIEEHRHKKSKELSGGTKRKLSVACSLIGSPRVVFMDEASSGLDPASRRHLWGLINELKTGKAIILTTHSMDEADFLCDRIAIMSDGKLKCLGTPMHLKHKYGSGYSLDIQPVDLSSNKTEIQNFVRTKFPDAVLVEKLGGVITYDIPTEKLSLARLFREFESNKQALGVLDFSVSQTSLEKVFLKFALEQTASDEHDNTEVIKKKKYLFC